MRMTRGPGGRRPGVVRVGTVARVRARTRSRPTRQTIFSGSMIQGPSGVNAPRWRSVVGAVVAFVTQETLPVPVGYLGLHMMSCEARQGVSRMARCHASEKA